MDYLTDTVPSEIGAIVVAARDGKLVSLDFDDCRDRMLALLAIRDDSPNLVSSRDPFGISSCIAAYLAGDIAAVDSIDVDCGGTPFQEQVWSALRAIPAGATMTYGALARALGRPAAARAVGAANGRNPISIVVPCHRLVGSDGALVRYGGGLHRKQWLLRHEGAQIDDASGPSRYRNAAELTAQAG